MQNNKNLKKQILYRSTHRGFKEMDLLLGKFVKKNIDKLSSNELKELEDILFIEDEIIYNWFFKKKMNKLIPNNKVTEMLKVFKI